MGDDDQALYRFRGATVENFVQFPQRCMTAFGVEPVAIPLDTNYRSRQTIVDFYTRFVGQVRLAQPQRRLLSGSQQADRCSTARMLA